MPRGLPFSALPHLPLDPARQLLGLLAHLLPGSGQAEIRGAAAAQLVLTNGPLLLALVNLVIGY